jgi:hypothetical protein
VKCELGSVSEILNRLVLISSQLHARRLRTPVSSCGNTGSIRDDSYWTSRENSLELIELSSINKVSLV